MPRRRTCAGSTGRRSWRRGSSYPDLVGAADVVVTKPGYGIVSDCIGAGTRLVYTDRGDFPEYPVMVAEMPRYLPAVFASNEEVREGRLGPALEAVLALPFPAAPRTDGAAVAAERLVGRLWPRSNTAPHASARHRRWRRRTCSALRDRPRTAGLDIRPPSWKASVHQSVCGFPAGSHTKPRSPAKTAGVSFLRLPPESLLPRAGRLC